MLTVFAAKPKGVEIVEPLKNVEAIEKDTITFTCELSISDRKDGKWKHLGKEITPKTKRYIQKDTNNSVENNRIEYLFKSYKIWASIFGVLKE